MLIDTGNRVKGSTSATIVNLWHGPALLFIFPAPNRLTYRSTDHAVSSQFEAQNI